MGHCGILALCIHQPLLNKFHATNLSIVLQIHARFTEGHVWQNRAGSLRHRWRCREVDRRESKIHPGIPICKGVDILEVLVSHVERAGEGKIRILIDVIVDRFLDAMDGIGLLMRQVHQEEPNDEENGSWEVLDRSLAFDLSLEIGEHHTFRNPMLVEDDVGVQVLDLQARIGVHPAKRAMPLRFSACDFAGRPRRSVYWVYSGRLLCV
mmetsp:Transcript_104630/g.249084  ORF Transcript_104630/g.249084 Transcript_104630/m.249084 type:complete len:209 (+) Transcript_104630:1891-2517(+)